MSRVPSLSLITHARPRRANGFTLVELLVVIGIIALLISILLPSLNKARQAANTAACLSNEHQIGLQVMQYVSQNHGFLPYGNGCQYPSSNYNYGSWNSITWTWVDTLQLMQTKQTNDKYPGNSWNVAHLGNEAYDYGGMFHDKDLASSTWANRATDYVANPRVLVDCGAIDYYGIASGQPAASSYMAIRKITSFPGSQGTMMIWCGGVNIGNAGTDTGGDVLAWQVDNGCAGSPLGLCYPPPPGSGWANGLLSNRISISTAQSVASYNGNVTMAILRATNRDGVPPYYKNIADMRFRHSGNNVCNALFIDGHCESRVLGSVYGRDIYVKGPTAYGAAPQ